MQRTAQFSKSKIPCLVRHRGGKYYASVKVGGKVIRRSLDTDDYGTASNRLPNALAEIRGAKNASEAGTLGAAVDAEAKRDDPTLQETTRLYYRDSALSLSKMARTMPVDPFGLPITKVSMAELRAFMDKYATKAAPTRYNGALTLLRRTYERAMEAGHVGTNLAAGFKRVRVVTLKMDMPTADQLAMIVENIRGQKKRVSKAVAYAVEFLAFTGLRISEARAVRWRDIRDGFLVVRTAKNDQMRQVPLIPAALGLFARLRAEGMPSGPNDRVMLVSTPRFALDHACTRLGLDHMRVHDLRHCFATRCIESGVDLPTLASWLGHKDGGVLCAQVDGHLCIKHSTAMAGKVRA